MKKQILNTTVSIIAIVWLLSTTYANYTLTNNDINNISLIENKIEWLVNNGKITYSQLETKLDKLSSKKNISEKNQAILNEISLRISEKMTPSKRNFTYKPKWGYAPTIAGTIFIEPSSTMELKVGQKIKNLTDKSYEFGITLQKLTPRMYWVQNGFYNSVFYVWDNGVLVMDTLAWGGGEKVIAAVKSVTDLPITTLIYSHQHEDHIGDVQFFLDEAEKRWVNLEIVSTDKTKEAMIHNGSTLTLATKILDFKNDSFKFEDETISVEWLNNAAHVSDSATWLFENEKVLHIPDYVNPNQVPYLGFGGSHTYNWFRDDLTQIQKHNFDYFSGGHGNIGSKADLSFMLEYTANLELALAQWIEASYNENFFIAKYNNHQASAKAERDFIISTSMDILRDTYGEMYGFEASAPYQLEMLIRAGE
jgi:glyoxylase-like metal-dependent hydrolase (beta-lactamase superfamily II)